MRCRHLLLTLMTFALTTTDTWAQSAQIRVTEPQRGATVGREMTVKGTVTKPPAHYVWVVARRQDFAPLFWPQREANLERDGRTWSATAVFGEPRDVGWEFDVGAVVVDQAGHDRLRQYWEKAMESGDWRPIRLPTAAAEHFVRVQKTRH